MTTTQNLIQFQAGKTTVQFLKSGDIYEINHAGTMYNQVHTNMIDGSLNNIYLRKLENGKIKFFPLVGVQSQSALYQGDNQLKWTGIAGGVEYEVIFSLTEDDCWFWEVHLQGNQVEVDVIYGQDVGLAGIGALQSNEAYVGQYIDHAVFKDEETGFTVCSRQNQPQSDNQFPYFQQGSLTKNNGYSTDGFQFYGLSYKETNSPFALTQENLANEIYQYEMAYTALQSEQVELNGKATFVFYGFAAENHPLAITKVEYQEKIQQAWQELKEKDSSDFILQETVKRAVNFGEPVQTESLTKTEIMHLFPSRQAEEYDGEQLLSFFTDREAHIVLKEKELQMERAHGHILLSGEHLTISDEIITTTSYMYGLFNAQVVLGNTSMNKLMSNARNALNVMKTSGQRIYIELNGSYHLLTMPSAFEMSFNYAKWYYKLADDMLIITNYTTVADAELKLEVRSQSGHAYKFIVTNQITMNENEYNVPFNMEKDGNTLTFAPDNQSTMAKNYPNLAYYMQIDKADFIVADDHLLVESQLDSAYPLVVIALAETAEFDLTIQGKTQGNGFQFAQRDFATEVNKYNQHFEKIMNQFKLTHENKDIQTEMSRLNTLAWWYTHNMLVHYLMPHGLEQYGGAAWGTRDVSQGPVEYFFATDKAEIVRDIIQTLFANQFENDGNWPQWFMFDKYDQIKAEESHGDVIVWPLKVVGDYLKRTGDYSLLESQIPYTDRKTFKKTTKTVSLLEHLRKEIDYIKGNFLAGTYLSCYGDGDWDDTLQPYDSRLKKNMASSWTVALTYQTLKQLTEVLAEKAPEFSLEIAELVTGIEKDFKKYMLQTDVIPGFVYMEDPEHVELMIHPTDTKTGIQYRLLPMTRSMIGELLTPEEAEAHYQLIRQELYHPDGVRLMNRPATYQGGVSTNFKRAEQAANFGREVGLQYVHAHIRFTEAMAKLGKADEVWRGFSVINPVQITDVVANAERRQSNAYFSSSDGNFKTRYAAQEHFSELKTGDVTVKGGWRIYSSGPGIYMNQLISNGLGIRKESDHLIFDPILTKELDGLIFKYECLGVPVEIHYHVGQQEVKGIKVNGELLPSEIETNRYRDGGIKVANDVLKAALLKSQKIDIYC